MDEIMTILSFLYTVVAAMLGCAFGVAVPYPPFPFRAYLYFGVMGALWPIVMTLACLSLFIKPLSYWWCALDEWMGVDK